MLTESEAAERWCPFARISEMGGTYNRTGPAANLQCIASACMAWRWQPLMVTDEYLAAVRKAADDIGDTTTNKSKATAHVTANRAKYGLPETPFRGRCGLAGPEIGSDGR